MSTLICKGSTSKENAQNIRKKAVEKYGMSKTQADKIGAKVLCERLIRCESRPLPPPPLYGPIRYKGNSYFIDKRVDLSLLDYFFLIKSKSLNEAKLRAIANKLRIVGVEKKKAASVKKAILASLVDRGIAEPVEITPLGPATKKAAPTKKAEPTKKAKKPTKKANKPTKKKSNKNEKENNDNKNKEASSLACNVNSEKACKGYTKKELKSMLKESGGRYGFLASKATICRKLVNRRCRIPRNQLVSEATKKVTVPNWAVDTKGDVLPFRDLREVSKNKIPSSYNDLLKRKGNNLGYSDLIKLVSKGRVNENYSSKRKLSEFLRRRGSGRSMDNEYLRDKARSLGISLYTRDGYRKTADQLTRSLIGRSNRGGIAPYGTTTALVPPQIQAQLNKQKREAENAKSQLQGMRNKDKNQKVQKQISNLKNMPQQQLSDVGKREAQSRAYYENKNVSVLEQSLMSRGLNPFQKGKTSALKSAAYMREMLIRANAGTSFQSDFANRPQKHELKQAQEALAGGAAGRYSEDGGKGSVVGNNGFPGVTSGKRDVDKIRAGLIKMVNSGVLPTYKNPISHGLLKRKLKRAINAMPNRQILGVTGNLANQIGHIVRATHGAERINLIYVSNVNGGGRWENRPKKDTGKTNSKSAGTTMTPTKSAKNRSSKLNNLRNQVINKKIQAVGSEINKLSNQINGGNNKKKSANNKSIRKLGEQFNKTGRNIGENNTNSTSSSSSSSVPLVGKPPKSAVSSKPKSVRWANEQEGVIENNNNNVNKGVINPGPITERISTPLSLRTPTLK